MKMFKNKKLSKILMIIFTIIIILSIIFSAIKFTSNFFEKNAKNYMASISKANSDLISNEFDNLLSMLESTSKMIALHDEINSSQVLQSLRKISDENGFKRMGITLPDGTSYTDDGITHDSKTRSYYILGMQGKSSVSEYGVSIIDEDPFIAFSCPIYQNGRIVGVLRATVCKSYFSKLFDKSNISKVKDFFLIDSKGTVILRSNTNYYEKVIKDDPKVENEVKKLEKNIVNNQEYCIEYNENNQKLYGYSVPFKYNNWALFNIQTTSKISENVNLDFFNDTFIAFILMIFVIIVISAFHFRYIIKQYKVKLNNANQLYNIIDNQTNSAFFEYDIIENKLFLSKVISKNLNCERVIQNVPEGIFNYNVIYKPHEKMLSDFFDRIKSGLNYNEAFLKYKKSELEYGLFKIYATTIFDENGTPIKAIGSVEDVNDSNAKPKVIVNDSLTGLYNRVTTKELINSYILANNEKCSFVLIDINNLYSINEKLGFDFGDEVIFNISKVLRNLFRSNDIIGRTGDGEFTIFLKNITSINLLDSKIKAILEEISKIILTENENFLTANIGVSMFPQNGNDFNELYQNADSALFISKKMGKGNYEYFEE